MNGVDCFTDLEEDILFECADAPKKGIAEGRAVIIGYNDIDREASTSDRSIVTDLVLKDGKKGILLTWFKDLANDNNTFAPNSEDIDGFIHSFLTRLPNSSAKNANRAHELKNGRFVIVYETNYKGKENKDAIKVGGWENGMKLTEYASNTNENSGAATFTLATEEGAVEQYPYNIFLEDDSYEVSKATFDTLFENQAGQPVV